MKIGIVLEGGAMRGIYTAGVLDVFLEQQIKGDGVIGVSAGAIHGCSYVSKQHGRSLRYYMKYCRNKKFMSLYSLITTGNLVNEQFCYHDIPERLDPFDNEAFERSRTKFYITCSNVETGRAEYQLCENLRDQNVCYLQASASMPFVSRIVQVGEKKLLDGGVCDSIPIREFLEKDYDRIIVVLTRFAGYRKKPSSLLFAKMCYSSYPNFIEALSNRYRNYNATLDLIDHLEEEGKIFVIRPSEDLHIKRMEKNLFKVKKQYELGRQDTLNKLEELKAFLK